MKQRNRTGLIVLLLVIFSIVALSVNIASAQSGQRVSYNRYTGQVSFIGASVANPLIVPAAVANGLSADARAGAILNAYASQFGVLPQDLVFTRSLTTADGRISSRYQQVYQGLPVLGGEIIVNATSAGGLVSMIGKASPALSIGTTPAITAAQAQQSASLAAARYLNVDASSLVLKSASLAIYDARLAGKRAPGAELVYEVVLSSPSNPTVRPVALVNAVTGGAIFVYNAIDTAFTGITSINNVASTVDQQQIKLPRATSELLSDGDFEDVETTAWTIKKGAGDKIKCNKEDKVFSHTGECAFKFKGGPNESTKIVQNISLDGLTFAEGDVVDFSAFTKGNKPAIKGKVKVVIGYGDGTSTKLKPAIGPSSDYVEVTDSGTLTSGDVNKIKVMVINKSTAGKLFVDDVSLMHTTAAETTNADLATYTANNTGNLPGTFLCDETNLSCTDGADPDADAAHKMANDVYNMYADWHGRDSLDDEGMQIVSSVHVLVGYCNAFWDDEIEQMGYGDGCDSSIVLDDVVGHELTHAVTTYTSNLVYAYESGAINESFSDVWGEFFDLTNNSPEDTPENRWRIGEELDTGTPGGGIRDMQDPTIFGNPDRMQSPLFYLGAGDNGGVHINSGVNNKAAYLMVDGDTFNGYTVTGIGIAKAVQIYYDTQTTKLTTNSVYADLYDALQQSCTELIGQYGITADDCQSVSDAVNATEMHLEGGVPAATAAVCVSGEPTFIFQDDLESGTAAWTSGTFAPGPNAWTLGDTENPLVGTASNYGVNPAQLSGSFAALAADVAIPADAYLHFDHNFAFEFDPFGFYDGGIIEYSTDGGATWLQLPSEANEEGLDYNGVVDPDFSNPLAGKNAFVAQSGVGVGSSRYTLAALSGENVRFRWSIGSDSIYGAEGWRVDNVKIYTCDEPARSSLGGSNALPLPEAPSSLTGSN